MEPIHKYLSNDNIDITFYNDMIIHVQSKIKFDSYNKYVFYNNDNNLVPRIICNGNKIHSNTTKQMLLENQIYEIFKMQFGLFTKDLVNTLTDLLLQYKEESLKHPLLNKMYLLIDDTKYLNICSYCNVLIQNKEGEYEIIEVPTSEYLCGYLDGLSKGGIERYLIGYLNRDDYNDRDTLEIYDENHRVIFKDVTEKVSVS